MSRNAANATHQHESTTSSSRFFVTLVHSKPVLYFYKKCTPLLRRKVLTDSKHLGADTGGEAVDLLSVQLNLLGVEHALQAAGLLGKLEQTLPLILGQGRLLSQGALSVLGLALGLPLCNLGLLTGELALVELEVVEIGVVGFDALEQEVASLLEEGVDGDVKVIDGRVQRGLDGVALELSQRCGLLNLVL